MVSGGIYVTREFSQFIHTSIVLIRIPILLFKINVKGTPETGSPSLFFTSILKMNLFEESAVIVLILSFNGFMYI